MLKNGKATVLMHLLQRNFVTSHIQYQGEKMTKYIINYFGIFFCIYTYLRMR